MVTAMSSSTVLAVRSASGLRSTRTNTSMASVELILRAR